MRLQAIFLCRKDLPDDVQDYAKIAFPLRVLCLYRCSEGHEEQDSVELQEDPIVHTHLAALYDTLLEQNLLRLIEPFSRVEVTHVASLIQLPTETVLTKLSQVSPVLLGMIRFRCTNKAPAKRVSMCYRI